MSQKLFANALQIAVTSKSEADRFHTYHNIYEQPIFDVLRSKYMDFFKTWWKSYELPLVSSDKCVVMYETRCHPNLEFLIYNLTYYAKGWGLIIYCSKANYTFICDILQHNRYRALLYIVRDDEGGKEVRDIYNDFIKRPVFWNSLPCKYMLLCEIDAYLRRPLPDDVLNYDYICSKWPWHRDLIGGGGISICTIEAMQRICNELPELADKIYSHDNWVAEAANQLNFKCNNTYFVEAAHFQNNNPIGLHNWWTFIIPHAIAELSHIYDNFLTLELPN